MKIGKIEKSYTGNQVRLTSRVETSEGTTELWYAVDREYEPYAVHENLDAFLLGLFIHAMKLGEDIHLDAPVSEKLFYNMKNSLIKLYSLMSPSFHEISLYPDELNGSGLQPAENNVVTGYSGGIDSFSLLADHLFNDDIPAHYKVTHFIYNNVGAHGIHASDFFHERFNHLRSFADEFGVPFVKVDSNLYDILDSSFLLSFMPRNVSSVLILQKLFSKYLFASSYNYDNLFIKQVTKDGYRFRDAYIQPVTHSLFGTENMECILTGSQYSRVEKTIQVAGLEPSYRYLYVCTDTDSGKAENCSVCFKCARTMLTLDILGVLHLYDKVFDIERYKQIKQPYIESILYKRDLFAREILQLAQDHNFRIPASTRLLGSKLIHPSLQQFRKNTPPALRRIIKRMIGLNRIR
jgi:hypothetical protein